LVGIVERFAFAVGGTVCHQLPERSFIVGGSQLAICARCAGIYSGIFSFFVTAKIFGFTKNPTEEADGRRKLLTAGLTGAALLTPLAADGARNAFGFWSSGENFRLLTGLLFAAALAIFYKIVKDFDFRTGRFNLHRKDYFVFMSGAGFASLIGAFMANGSGFASFACAVFNIIIIMGIFILFLSFASMIYQKIYELRKR